ncbi:helix-turn-helix domain-containing protein [Enterococcus faecalis]|nr:helix-turn-helix domain-containing protein [Enterococcus faecalis]
MRKYNKKLIPYITIFLAIKQDVEAIQAIIHYYESYMIRLCQNPVVASDGSIGHTQIDEEMKNRLEIKLMIAILQFKLD